MRRFAVLLPILSGILFGSSGLFIRVLTSSGFSNLSILFIRTSIAALLLGGFMLIKDRSLFKVRMKDIWVLALSSIVGMFATNVLFNVSCVRLSLSLAASLLAIFPVYVLILSSVLYKERITRRKIICMILALAGCFLVTGVVGSDIVVDGKGLVIGILSGISYGLYGIFSKKAMGKGYDSLTITFYSIAGTMVVTAPMADYHVIGTFVAEAPALHIGFLILHSLCVAVLSYISYTASLKYIDAGKAAILASCEPVAAMVFGLIFYREIPTVLSITGLALMLVALAMLCKSDE